MTAVPHADTARKLASTIEPRRAEIERGRRLPLDLVAQLAGAGLFSLCVPRAYGGGEVEPDDLVETIEAVARADGSTGWCVMIGATSGMVAAYLPDDEARAIYGSASDIVTGGVFAPRGTATPVDGGFRMNGRWAFASGSQHCAWLMGGCLVNGADGARDESAPDPGCSCSLRTRSRSSTRGRWRGSAARGATTWWSPTRSCPRRAPSRS